MRNGNDFERSGVEGNGVERDAFEVEFARHARALGSAVEAMAPARPVLDRPAPQARSARGGQLPIGMAFLASAAVIAAIVATRAFGGGTGPGASSGTPTTTPSGTSTATAPAVVSASPTSVAPSPTLPPIVAGFSAPGTTGSWGGFSWGQIDPSSGLSKVGPQTQVVRWRGGYVAFGRTDPVDSPKAAIWASPDGATWTPGNRITGTDVLVAEYSGGLVAVSTDANASPVHQTLWTSTDGVDWAAAGSPAVSGVIASLAGGPKGLVATVQNTYGTGKATTETVSLLFSTDGRSWTEVTVQAGLSWAYGPQLAASDGRFFLFGGLAAAQAKQAGDSVVYWSDDGRTWTRSGGSTGWIPSRISFGRDGMVMETSTMSVPGATGLARSTDGGKTWVVNSSQAPLGPLTCGVGECGQGPDGAIAGNGEVLIAVKSDGHAWTSYNGVDWSAIEWGGPKDVFQVVALPRGVVADGWYGAAK